MAKLFVLITVCLFALTGFSQTDNKSKKTAKAEKEAKRIEEVKALLDAKDFIFVATYALPMSGTSIYLSSQYDLKIKSDSAFAYLPYFGVAYYAEYGGGNGGIEFQEPLTDYSMKSSKSGKEIVFKADAPKDDYRFRLSVSDTGYATLHVTCNNRQPIQFYGMIEKRKE